MTRPDEHRVWRTPADGAPTPGPCSTPDCPLCRRRDSRWRLAERTRHHQGAGERYPGWWPDPDGAWVEYQRNVQAATDAVERVRAVQQRTARARLLRRLIGGRR